MNDARLRSTAEQDPSGVPYVLIVDDDPRIAICLSTMLRNLNRNYRVDIARTGERALEILKNFPMDLLVTDFCMPGINGLELIRRVQASSPQTRIILITAYGKEAVKAEARRLQVYCCIDKPFDVMDFAQTVEEALCTVALPPRWANE